MLLFSLGYSFAGDIVVLTSLPDKDIKTQEKIYSIVRDKMPTPAGHKIIQIDKADLETLYQYLNSPDTFALFWVGHGAYSKAKKGKAVAFTPILLDHQKKNIAPVFKKVHPNIKFLGIIGCNSSQILNMDTKANAELGYYLPKKKVVARWGVRRAIRRFRSHIKRNSNFTYQENMQSTGHKVTISRIASNNKSSLLVFAGDTLLGIMPEAASGEEQIQDFFIPQGSKKIIVRSGHNPFEDTDYFGEITIKSWNLFARADGTPFGTNERIFMYKGAKQDLGPLESYFTYGENN